MRVEPSGHPVCPSGRILVPPLLGRSRQGRAGRDLSHLHAKKRPALMFTLLLCEHQRRKADPGTLQSARKLSNVRGQVEAAVARLFVFCARGRLYSHACCSLFAFQCGRCRQAFCGRSFWHTGERRHVYPHVCACVWVERGSASRLLSRCGSRVPLWAQEAGRRSTTAGRSAEGSESRVR